jgi:hypothetical protein
MTETADDVIRLTQAASCVWNDYLQNDDILNCLLLRLSYSYILVFVMLSYVIPISAVLTQSPYKYRLNTTDYDDYYYYFW